MQIDTILYIALPFCLIGLTLFSFFIQKRLKQSKGRKTQNKGILAEEKALIVLKKQGFKLIDQNPIGNSFITISDKKYDIHATPDLMMKRGNQNWIFEVKSQNATNIHKASVRRQLREYAALFPKYKLAFFDANTQTWDEIIFPSPTKKRLHFKFTCYLTLGTCIGIALERYFISYFF